MATARILLLLLCFVTAYGNWLPDRNLLSKAHKNNMSYSAPAKPGSNWLPGDWPLNYNPALQDQTKEVAAKKIISIAEKELGVKELSGKNNGPRVEAYLAYVGLKKGHAWCAAFVSWVYGQAGYHLPKSAWSPQLFPATRLRQQPAPALLLGIYFPALKRIAHVGLVTGLQHDWVHAIEGNTNPAGSREGEGVYRRLRHKRFIHCYAAYL